MRVTIWNEYVQEKSDDRILAVHDGKAIHEVLEELIREDGTLEVGHVLTMDMPECGLTEAVLDDTDVLIWWAHIAHDQVPYEIAMRVRDYVNRGMGIIFLHSAHMCRPMQLLLGTSCTLRWREGDREMLWCCHPGHPIAKGIENGIYLEKEEMYGEYFDIPQPDELVFISGFEGGEVFRSGCVWNRGYGKVFYFQPGHETNRSYHHPQVRKIIQNAVHYVGQPSVRLKEIRCLAIEQKKGWN